MWSMTMEQIITQQHIHFFSALNPQEARIAGGLLGLLIGDAMGVPYEFREPEQIPPLDALNFVPPSGFARAHAAVPPATWSDDGAQALCLLASLLACSELNLDDFAARLVRWHDEGYMAVDGIVFDVGISTGQAIRALKAGQQPALAGGDHEQSNGNGSLMRALPLALWHRGTDAELIRDARQQSLVTHRHLRAQLCCALYCLWARRILEGVAEPWAAATKTLRQELLHDAAAIHELDDVIRPDDPAIGEGSGYVVDALHSARFAAEATNYAETLRRAIRLGHDTDTTACIAGGIAGLNLGLTGIFRSWRNELRGQELFMPLLDALIAWHQSAAPTASALAAISAPWPSQWCLVGNIVAERTVGHGGRLRRSGTKHFAAGSKVWCSSPRWDPGKEDILVVGRHRGSKRFTNLVIRRSWVTNWRAQVVYNPEILRRLNERDTDDTDYQRPYYWESEEDVLAALARMLAASGDAS